MVIGKASVFNSHGSNIFTGRVQEDREQALDDFRSGINTYGDVYLPLSTCNIVANVKLYIGMALMHSCILT